MAEIVTPLVSRIMENLGEFIFEKVKRQFIYLCCFNSNIENLKKEAENLKNETDDLQSRVEAAHRNTDNTSSVVQAWITDSKKIQDDTNGIEDEIKNVKSGCLAIKSRFLLSRKARKTADAIKVHREKGKFEPEEIAVPGLPPAMTPIPQGPSEEFDSRKKIEEEIMEDLRGGKVHMMGICGMGGVGKTTMAERIMDRVRGEKLFEEVVKIVISQKVNGSEIQREIAENFGVTLEEKSLSARANKLHKRLTDATRKFLILDDIWEELDLKNLGIPCKSDEGAGCTMLITSRNREVLRDMNAKPFGVQILSPEEALLLFRGKIGTCSEPEEILKQVVEECEGLPLALVTVGGALKDKSTEHWNDALRKLKSSNPNIPKVLKKVYEPIKVSYDFLDNPDARSLFLLCCLFPEDCDIPLEFLTMYGMGLRMFTDQITTLEEARDTVRVLVHTLKTCFLLLDGSEGQNAVKMHDVVRDVAIYIASEEGRIVRNLSSKASGREDINCEWISAVGEEINKLPIRSSFRSLRLLILMDEGSTEPGITTEPSIFQGMIELNVLSLFVNSFESLPETTQLLKNLRTLHLVGCDSLEKISIVGELLNLEILICRSCESIAEMPIEIGRLKQLRMLEVNECPELKRIAPGVMSNLVQLEELIILESFNEWETKANGEHRKNAALCEIEHLENLTRLEIDIENPTLTAEEIRFPSKIVKFAVKVGGEDYWFDESPYERKMSLSCEGDSTFGKWIHVFLTSTEYLHAYGEGANNLGISQAQKLKSLIVDDCSMDRIGVFPLLESLQLSDLPNLEEICVGPIHKPSNSFGNLKELTLFKCIKLRKLFSTVKDDLLQLETLEIDECEMMEHVFDEMDREECQKITFPKLDSLELSSLSSLISFYKGSASIEFPLLQRIVIKECEKLKSLNSSIGDSRNLAQHHHSFHVFFNQKVIFHNLMEIHINGCAGIGILFSSSTAVNLVKLEQLNIEDCKEMVKVIEDDDDVLCDERRILFPSLKGLCFFNLPKLQIFCSWKCELDLPSLELVTIKDCPLLEFLTMKSVGFPILKKIDIREHNNIRSLFLSSVAKNFANLIEMRIIDCTEMVKVIENDEDMLCENPPPLFPCLKYLYFENLPKLQSFGKGRFDELPSLESIQIDRCSSLEVFTAESVGFPILKKIDIREHNNIRSLFLSSVAKNLANLMEMRIIDCTEMVKVIEDDEDMLCENPPPLFPCLKHLYFENLPKLQSFGKGRFDELPSLESIQIDCCSSLEVFTAESVGFHSLKQIMISGCNNSRSLFSSSIAKNFINLKELGIGGCKEMIKVIEDDEEMLCEKPLLLFPCLKIIQLMDLPKLESFCNWKCDLQLSSLEEVSIGYCPLLACFTMGNVTTENLNDIRFNWKGTSLGDLNTVIKRHFNSGGPEDIGGGGHTFIEESTSVETKGVEAHNEKIETQVGETIEENEEM